VGVVGERAGPGPGGPVAAAGYVGVLGPNRAIVVAEDDAATGQMVAALLSTELGARVLLVPDGQRAVEAVRRVRPALVLLDLLMPKLDGLEVAARLKADPATAAIPIVALSASGQRAAAMRAGCDRFVPKPFLVEDLLTAVDDALRRPPNPAGAAPTPASNRRP
jgi:two-component system cell cycle response regulator DivK